jgi:hypothetical protein
MCLIGGTSEDKSFWALDLFPNLKIRISDNGSIGSIRSVSSRLKEKALDAVTQRLYAAINSTNEIKVMNEINVS